MNKLSIGEIRKAIRGIDSSIDWHRQDMVRAVRDVEHRNWLRQSFNRHIAEVQALVIPPRFVADARMAEENIARAQAEVAKLDAMA